MESRFYREKVCVPLYRGMFHIVLTDSKEEYDSVYDDDFMDEVDYLYGHSMHTGEFGDREGCYVMVLNLWADKRVTHGIIAHEALHIVNFILSHVGSEFDDDNHEHYTYLLEWVIGVVYGFLVDEGLMDYICVGVDDLLDFCDRQDINIDNSFVDDVDGKCNDVEDVPGEGDGGVDNSFVGDSINHTCPPGFVVYNNSRHIVYKDGEEGVLMGGNYWLSMSVYHFLISNDLIHKI